MTEKRLFPGITQEQIDNSERAEKLKAAQKAMAEEAVRKEKQKKKAYNKYSFSPTEKVFGGAVLSAIEAFPKLLALNVATFLIGSVGWAIGSKTGVSTVDNYDEVIETYYFEHRNYKQAFIDAYNPVKDGKFDPHFWWYVNMALILSVTIYSVIQANNKLKSTDNKYKKSIDLMLEIERLAKEHKLDPTIAKKIVTVAPHIVEHMSEDSRIYFDMIMDGKISASDENFLNIATSIMVGHLKTHPEDMELVMSTFDKKSIPDKLMAMYKKQQERR